MDRLGFFLVRFEEGVEVRRTNGGSSLGPIELIAMHNRDI
jgi:hypothetical protein